MRSKTYSKSTYEALGNNTKWYCLASKIIIINECAKLLVQNLRLNLTHYIYYKKSNKEKFFFHIALTSVKI